MNDTVPLPEPSDGAPPRARRDARSRAADGKPPPEIAGVEISGVIGEGGMGIVYSGTQAFLGRPVAVKVLKLGRDDQAFVERFRREARLLAEMKHENIVACYQADVSASGDCYIVMERIRGPSLRRWIDEHGPLSPATAIELARELLLALTHAYEVGVERYGSPIIHRDVKPENVLLEPRGRSSRPAGFAFVAKLADLGLARPVDEGSGVHLTGSGVSVGTPATMAPEQFHAPEDVDFRADVYGLGCVLYHALVGEPAFRGRSIAALVAEKDRGEAPDPRRRRPRVPEEVGALVVRMLAGQRELRPASYQELQAELDRLSLHLRGAAPARRTTRYAAAGVLLIAAVAAGYALSARESDPQRPIEPFRSKPRVVDKRRPRPTPPVPPPREFAFEGVEVEPALPREGGEVQLCARAFEPRPDEATYSWRQTGGRIVELVPEGLSARFSAPLSTAPYALSFEVVRRVAGEPERFRALDVTIDAADDPPAVEIATPAGPFEPGDRVRLVATIADPERVDEFSTVWTAVGARSREIPVTAEGAVADLVVPDAEDDYRLRAALVVEGLSPQGCRKTCSLDVQVEPALEWPADGDLALFPKESSVFPAFWKPADPLESVYAGGDPGEVFAAWADPAREATRAVPLPRGAWNLRGAMQIYATRERSDVPCECGLRIAYRSDQAIWLGFSCESGECQLVLYRVARDDGGAWRPTEPLLLPSSRRSGIGWKFALDLRFEIAWDGERLDVTGFDERDGRRIFDRLAVTLPARPTSLVLHSRGNRGHYRDFVLSPAR